MPEQTCGACKWFRLRTHYAIVSDCVFRLPPLPVALKVEWSEMYKSDGTDCPTFERKETGK